MTLQCLTAPVVLALTLFASDARTPSAPQQSFDTMKGLVGRWHGKDTLGHQVTATFRLTANGTALLSEYVEYGVHEDMITMIHRDGDRVLATHYCSAGNQPRMSGTMSSDGKTVTFEFVDGTNIPSPESGHMQRWVIRTLDSEHHVEEWTYIENGKEQTVVSDMHRVTG